jgi:P-type E1-E2 ATPase
VVPEDIVVLNEGDRVPADAQVVESVLLAVDESLLTGESLPVRKVAAFGENSIGEGDTISAGGSGWNRGFWCSRTRRVIRPV